MWNLFNCYLSGRHEFSAWCEPGSVFLRCIHCGKRASGWALDQKPQRKTAPVTHVHVRHRRRLALRLLVECPARRPLAAVDAAEEHRAWFTPGAEFVTSRKVAIEQVPHREFLDRRSFSWGVG